MLGCFAEGIQEAVQAAASNASVLLPPNVAALPEETAWQMIYMEGGAMAGILALAVTVLWKLVSKILAETRAQNSELVSVQAAAVQRLAEAVAKVETAIRMSDTNNQNALGRITDNLAGVIVRMDKHEQRLDRHSDRINTIEVQHAIDARTGSSGTGPRSIVAGL